MSDTIIRVENLSKKYIISHQKGGRSSYQSLRESISDGVISLSKKLVKSSSNKTDNLTREEFWSLKDVSFEIKQGERVGIIGRNGAGKSTLLKILSRITEPTNGSIQIKGRVASLLEVGTGFHPELSGRENIYLNGAILGMTKEEIKRKFDEIVSFAEVEKFLDTPVKWYSSGMYVRLAFAVAAHLEPEILIVDEVLAVGDTGFQKKCLGKMDEVSQSGRTIIFVSHNMSIIQSLCPRCILLQKGHLIADNKTNFVTKLFLEKTHLSGYFVRPKQENGKPTITFGKILREPDFEQKKIQVNLEIFAESQQKIALEFRLCDATAYPVGFADIGRVRSSQLIVLTPGINQVSFRLPIHRLAIGSYFISLDLCSPDKKKYLDHLDRADLCLSFDVLRANLEEEHLAVSQELFIGSVEFPLEVV